MGKLNKKEEPLLTLLNHHLAEIKASIIGYHRQGATTLEIMEITGVSITYITKVIQEYFKKII